MWLKLHFLFHLNLPFFQADKKLSCNLLSVKFTRHPTTLPEEPDLISFRKACAFVHDANFFTWHFFNARRLWRVVVLPFAATVHRDALAVARSRKADKLNVDLPRLQDWQMNGWTNQVSGLDEPYWPVIIQNQANSPDSVSVRKQSRPHGQLRCASEWL